MRNPFSGIKTVYKAQELLDIAFKRGSKLDLRFRPGTPDIIKARNREKARITTVTDNLLKKLTEMVKTFPSFDNIHPFYYDLAKTIVDLDKFKQNIAAITGIIKVVKRVHQEHFNKIRRAQTPSEAGEARKAFYGRISSIIGQLEDKLNYLREHRDIFRKLPTISPEIFTIVVAGYPNVGKSSLVQSISTATPEISYYPFTTRNLIVGHRILNEEDPLPQKVQILDTPGLLDRPLSKRNNIELKAIIALKHLANVIVFIIDPSETCGYPISNQTHLLREISKAFSEIPFIITLNKLDLVKGDQIDQVTADIRDIFPDKEIPILKTIAVQREGVEQIFEAAMKYYPDDLILYR